MDMEDVEKSRRLFDASGTQSVKDIRTALAGIGRTLDTFPRILDFGCGSGRVTRWLPFEAPSSELHACDIDEQAIAWCRDKLPGIEFARNEAEPPLPYADESFDLVVNHSVFTHLDERMQDAWLAELRRVTKKGGIGLLSVHGPTAFALTEDSCRYEGDTPAVLRKELEHDGILYVTSDAFVGSSFPSFYHTTFHAPWYVFEHWSRWFSVLAYLSRADLDFQDIVLLRRDEAETRILPIATAGALRRSGLPDLDASSTERHYPSIADINADRVPPLVGAALERLGDRVTMLEAAMVNALSQPQPQPQPQPVDKDKYPGLTDADTDRVPPVLGPAFEHLGRRVNRLEAALAGGLLQPKPAGEDLDPALADMYDEELVSPIVGAALERLGQRVTRLEVAADAAKPG
jgi:SAM-dependent methyltransferase